MHIQQIYDEGLAHASYTILIGAEVVVIDPARNPSAYLQYVEKHNAEIVAVIETHPHADFVSSHLELHRRTGATIYTSTKTAADYPHIGFDEGTELRVGVYTFRPLNTPGHSPDSISIVLENEAGEQQAVFTGDTLFVGDVGRPDLRESAGNFKSKRRDLARDMYYSLHDKLANINPAATVYPAHGAGSLCGKGLSDERTSTIRKELDTNPAFQPETEEAFIEWLLQDQPFVPAYFPYNVDINQRGAPAYGESIGAVRRVDAGFVPEKDTMVVDVRDESVFKKGFHAGALNIQLAGKFETWLGSLVPPRTPFYLVAGNKKQLDEAVATSAKIGYEAFVKGAFTVFAGQPQEIIAPLNLDRFKAHTGDYTIVDVRNAGEVEQEGKKFPNAINIPLPELRDRATEIPEDKPIVVHCAGGYRSAAAASIVRMTQPKSVGVFDLSEAVKDFS
ncbi:MAG: MBL fold metallo-hydrolase [Saprospiraceae bacterium]